MDGFDVQAMGYVAPAVLAECGADRSVHRRPVFAAANFGVLLGSLVFSMVADKIGRRPVIVWSTVFFSVMTIATAYAQTLEQTALVTVHRRNRLGLHHPECDRARRRVQPEGEPRDAWSCASRWASRFGAAIGGFVAAWLIPHSAGVRYSSSAASCRSSSPWLMLWALPESLQFLAVRRRRFDQLARWLKAARADAAHRREHAVRRERDEPQRRAVLAPVPRGPRGLSRAALDRQLHEHPRAVLVVELAADARRPAWVTTSRRRCSLGTLLQVGGTVGTFGLAWFIARARLHADSAHDFAVAVVSIALIGHPGISLTVLSVIVFIAGWCVVGGQPGLNALSASYYPTYLAIDRRRRRPRCRPDRRDRRPVYRRRVDRRSNGARKSCSTRPPCRRWSRRWSSCLWIMLGVYKETDSARAAVARAATQH